jgi:hypothetical protein
MFYVSYNKTHVIELQIKVNIPFLIPDRQLNMAKKLVGFASDSYRNCVLNTI